MKTDKSKKNKEVKKVVDERQHLLSEELSFAVQEAYKTLRTNIMFSIPEEGCKKIVVTSSLQGEAKSTTAVNLAIAFAQNNSKVLLIDCDLRLPTVAQKLGEKETPGLSNVIVGLCGAKDAIQKLSNGIYLLPAGDIPPNPTELLGSEQMHRLLDELGEEFEYIILDTPPVCTVADATILSKVTSGVIMVVRQNVAKQETVSEALRRLEFSEAKILGFIYTCVENNKSSYGKSGYYGYGYDRENADGKSNLWSKIQEFIGKR